MQFMQDKHILHDKTAALITVKVKGVKNVDIFMADFKNGHFTKEDGCRLLWKNHISKACSPW